MYVIIVELSMVLGRQQREELHVMDIINKIYEIAVNTIRMIENGGFYRHRF